MKSEEVVDLESLLLWCRKYGDSIYVRAKIAPKGWGSVALSDLTDQAWASHVVRFAEEGIIPCRVLSEGDDHE